MPQRVLGNVFIAIGGLSPAVGGTLAARGLGDVLFVSELLGAVLLFIGFRLATTQQPVRLHPRRHRRPRRRNELSSLHVSDTDGRLT